MRIEHSYTDNYLVVKLIGELDEHFSGYARMTIDNLSSEKPIDKLIIDMTELTFMDSTGIGVLIGRYKNLSHRGISIYLKSPSAAVDRVLRISGIYDIMTKVG